MEGVDPIGGVAFQCRDIVESVHGLKEPVISSDLAHARIRIHSHVYGIDPAHHNMCGLSDAHLMK
jgi:hypothetical protein